MNKLIKSDMIEATVKRVQSEKNVSAAVVGNVINHFLDAVKDHLKNGNSIQLKGLGSFNIIETKERRGKNRLQKDSENYGREFVIPPGKKVSFKPSKEIISVLKPTTKWL